ncbi:polymorphic toxin-type HINT domain-containing protein [Streptomyces sp. NPDC094049]|uniref:polymorphic toxin-type HINT domain-containing protein n=1 Tax=Streptomyces sp. NPDC094049 TaxID=3154987 RepID=UPI003323B3C8
MAGATVLAVAVSLTPGDFYLPEPVGSARAVGGSTEAITAGRAPQPLPAPEPLPTAPRSAAPVWPVARTAEVVPGTGAKTTAADPVTVTQVDGATLPKVRISTLAHGDARRLGTGGIAFTLTPEADSASATGTAPEDRTTARTRAGKAKSGTDDRRRARIHVDYTGVKGAAGGNFTDRVRLVRYPGCVLTRPQDPACAKPERVAARNDLRTGELVADVSLAPATAPGSSRSEAAPAVYALSAGASGNTGSFTATPMTGAGSWQSGGNAGNFSYSYPLTLPDVAGGSDPSLGLSYSSQAVDGRTSASNNQASAIGTGWEIGQSYIERRYQSCSEQSEPTWGDLCWSSENATISLNGVSGELIRVDKNNWRLKNDQGWKIERYNGEPNGDENGEHWIVSTSEGTRYYFGLATQPTTGTATNSTWTVPVFGKKAGSPCEGQFCTQAWRWNLSLVKDRHDTEATYFYGKDTNRYHQKGGTAPTVAYDRGGYLKSIEYGHRPGAEASKAPGRVAFSYAYRCATLNDACAAPTASSTAASYPDVPVDLICTATSCPDKSQPAFFDTRFLTRVDAQVADRDPAKPHRTVDAYTFVHQFPATGETNFDPSLWLSKVLRTGYAADGSTLALRPTDFNGTLLPNRVDPPAGSPKMNSYRISTVTNELGGRTKVTYGLDANGDGQATEGCTPTTLPTDESTNTRLCYKMRYVADGGSETTGWFHKYLTLKVSAQDGANLTPERPVTYQYLGGGAWHWTDDELTPVAKQSWADWRGYAEVVTKAGTGNSASVSRSRYHRGMNGDRTGTGGTKTVKVAADFFADLYPAEDLTDHEYLAGQIRSSESLTADGLTVLKATKTQHWYKLLVDGTGDHDAYFVRPQTTTTKARTASGGYRATRNTLTYNGTWGMPEKVVDEGDLAVTTDSKCTVTSFSVTTSLKFLLVTPYRVELREATGATCGATVHSRSDTYYDKKHAETDLGSPATQGDVTRVDVWFNGQTASRAFTTYDVYGRGLDATDPAGATTYTRYSPATGNPEKIQVINAKGHMSETDLDPLRGNPVKVIDPNGGTTSTVYDALGRVTEARLPGDPTTAEYPASYSFEYQMTANAASRVTTRQLLGIKQKNGSFQPYSTTSYAYLDTLGTTVETQSQSPLGGRVVSTGTLDDQGRVISSSGSLYVTGAAGSGLASPPAAQWPSETRTTYDSLGQATESALYSKGVYKWKTTSNYAADRTTVTPPTGGTATTYVNALGQTTKSVGQVDTGKTAVTSFTYNIRGELTAKKDENLDVTSTYTYDWQGRPIETGDPDRGRQWLTYDPAGRLKTSTDAEQRQTVFSYDELGRPVDIHRVVEGAIKPLATFTYDTLTNGLGKPVASSRVQNGRTYTTRVTGYDDHGRPTGKQTVVPAEEGALAGTYTYSYEYTTGGAPTSVVYPAAGGLPEERVNTSYDDLGFVTGVRSDLADYTSALTYDGLGRLVTRTAGSGDRRVDRGYKYDEVTGRITNMNAASFGQLVQDVNYRYDEVGNVLAVNDGTTAQQQCYSYDLGHRMTRAWTQMWPNGGAGCTAPSAWGPAPYDEQYTYDEAGRILSTVKDGVSTAHSYGPTGSTANRPHAPVKVGGATYRYNKTGQLDTRTIDNKTDTFTWEFEQLTKIATADGKETSFVYGADGQRLIRNEPTGSTLYLDGMEVSFSAASGTKATRYYDGGVVRVSKGAGSSTTGVLVTDAQGSASVAVDQSTGAVTRQRYTPFGAPRGGANGLEETTDRDYLGQPRDDSTGLIATGARYYDPTIASFISVDPALDQTGDAYGYGNNNPGTFSDPTGLAPDDCSFIGVSCKPTGGGGFDVTYNKEYYEKRGHETPAERQLRIIRNNKEAAEKKVEVIKKEIINIIGDLIGYNDARDCFTKGDVWACINTGLNMVPWGKLFKIAKAGYKAWKAWGRLSEAWGDIRAADKALGAAEEAVAAERQAAKLADDAAEAKASDDALDGISCATDNSFVPGTPVLMADGTTKPIEEVANGDQVLATDPETGETASKEVTHTIARTGEKQLVELVVDTDGEKGDKTEKLTATHNHPFWVESTKTWTDATDLRPGDTLRTSAGTYVQVTAITRWTQTSRVHNLTVADTHTYYVVAGVTPVLVHNCGKKLTDVALGTSDNGLEVWANGNGYTHFMGETRDGSISSAADAMNYHPEATIHVRLDGFKLHNREPGSPAEVFDYAVQQGHGDNWFTTQREMAFLERAFRVGNLDSSRLRFYLGGSSVTSEVLKGSKYLGGS